MCYLDQILNRLLKKKGMIKKYNSISNKKILLNGANKMITDLYNDVDIDTLELNNILTTIMNNLSNDSNNTSLEINQINRNTLANIKKIYEDNSINNENKQEIKKIENELLDNDVINKKLKELEKTRRIMPNILNNKIIQQPNIKDMTNLQPSNLNQNYKNNEDKIYKNFIINSNTRDWFINYNRNNLVYNIPLDIRNNEIYPIYLCLSYKIKNITPYVILNISDSIKNINYTFICDKINGNWDIWKPSCENIEPLELNNKHWKLTFFDHNNKLLDIGHDCYDVKEVTKIDNRFKLIIPNKKFNNDDNIIIRTYKGLFLNKKIEKKDDNIYITNENISIEDFKNSKILDCMEQYSFIIKYTSKLY